MCRWVWGLWQRKGLSQCFIETQNYRKKNSLKLKYWKPITKYTGFIVLDERNVQEEQEKRQKEQAKPDEKFEPNKDTESSKRNTDEEGSKGYNSEK